MTREEAIKCIETHIVYHRNGEYGFPKTNEALEMAIAALRERDSNANQRVANTSNALDGWISVEEKMPEPGQMVLVYCRSQMHKEHITVSTYKEDYSYKMGCYWSRRVKKVTHWMPLPEPPEVEG